MNPRICDEELRTCLTHQPFHQEPTEVSEVPEQPLTCSIENYMGIVSKSSLSHQAAAIRRMQERRQKFSDFMPK